MFCKETYPAVRDYDSTQFVSLYMLVFLNMAIASAAAFSIIKWAHCVSYIWMAVAALIPLGISCLMVYKFAKERF